MWDHSLPLWPVLLVVLLIWAALVWRAVRDPHPAYPPEIRTAAGRRTYLSVLAEGAEHRYALECARARDEVARLSATTPAHIRRATIARYFRLRDARQARVLLFRPSGAERPQHGPSCWCPRCVTPHHPHKEVG
jgi:hypothetical protein